MTTEIQIEPHIEEVKFIQEEISEIKEESQVDDSIIEDKLRKMMPEIISKIKSQISEEIKDRSKISLKSEIKNEPIITE